MASPDIATREPEIFAAGDSLIFQRYLPAYRPADGWSLHYVLTDLQGNEKAACDSAPNPANAQAHLVDVDGFAATLDDGDYILTGQAVNVSGEKHQIYYAALTLQPDLSDGAGAGPVQTEAQEMIALLRDTLKSLYKLKFAETEDLRSKFRIQDQTKVLGDLKYWKEVRASEIQQERVRNGRSPGNFTVPVFHIG